MISIRHRRRKIAIASVQLLVGEKQIDSSHEPQSVQTGDWLRMKQITGNHREHIFSLSQLELGSFGLDGEYRAELLSFNCSSCWENNGYKLGSSALPSEWIFIVRRR
jgi:hypothetical protein